MTRRPRGTPEQAIGDVKAAMGRLAKGRPNGPERCSHGDEPRAEAAMSRKHLYHYFDQVETLAEAWRQTAASRGSAAAASGQADTARVRDLEQRLNVWKMLAAVAAEAEHEAELNAALCAENARLRQRRRALKWSTSGTSHRHLAQMATMG